MVGDTVQYKVVVLGNGAVGKTSLCNRFVEGAFADSYRQTIGLDFFIKKLELGRKGGTAALQIWDIGGMSLGSRMLQKYVYGADAVLLVYDITCEASFLDLEAWLEMSKLALRRSQNRTLFALVANKSDLGHARAVELRADLHFSSRHKIDYSFVVSAKTGDSVRKAFIKIAGALSGLSDCEIEEQCEEVNVVDAEVVHYPTTVDTSSRARVVMPQHERLKHQSEHEQLRRAGEKLMPEQRKRRRCLIM